MLHGRLLDVGPHIVDTASMALFLGSMLQTATMLEQEASGYICTVT